MSDQLHENLKKLSQAIMNSLMESEEVHEILKNITHEQKLSNETPLVIVVELKQIKSILDNSHDKENDSYVEGKVVSDGEEQFIKFCDEEFNEDEWLMKLRLTF